MDGASALQSDVIHGERLRGMRESPVGCLSDCVCGDRALCFGDARHRPRTAPHKAVLPRGASRAPALPLALGQFVEVRACELCANVWEGDGQGVCVGDLANQRRGWGPGTPQGPNGPHPPSPRVMTLRGTPGVGWGTCLC